ncbi:MULTISPECIES: hypothetical protein [Kosakonia]|uniref:hypothetical protein n=1 Tax=Kosakonia TaxID=1330547 RepID=UPI0005EF335C|nr:MULTISPECIES: hypothetical protein [Kosakonia]RCX00345.1 hypothetical protein DFO56_106313 [Kosakonia sp. AG348]
MGYYFDFLNAPELVDEKLEFFIRDRAEEERLDDMLITQGFNVRFSFAFYCRYLNHVISIYNDVKYERIKLLTFLKNSDIGYINYILDKSPHREYIIRLLDFTEELQLKLNIKSPYRDKVDFGIDKIISEIDLSNGDLLNASYNSVFRHIHKCSFGYAFLDRNTNFYVCNNLGNFYEEINSASVAIRRSVIIINGDIDVDNNLLSELFIRYLTVRIVYKKNGKWKKWVDSRNGFRLGFEQIMDLCEKILNSKKYIEPELKQIIIDLHSWLYHTRNKVERYFENYHTLHVKKRDFTALNSTMRIFSHKIANTITFNFHREAEIIERKLNDVGDALSFYFDELNILYELPSMISSCIKRIREDANLYRVDTKTPFKENNLSAALNNWLNGRFVGHNMEAKSEENIGNGRTDISIFFNSSRVAIIESKLIRFQSDKNNIKQSIQSGFYQVFTKYSSFLNQEFLFPPRLYLVLFAIDADYKKIRDQIFSVINDLQNEPGLTLIEGPKVSSTCYRYIASSLAGDSLCDRVFIDIILADLRVNDNLDRKHGRYPLS